MKRIILATILLAISSFGVHAQSSSGGRVRDIPRLVQSGPAMKDGESYYITYTCRVTSDLPAYIRSQSSGFNRISGATEVFAITGSDSTINGDAFNPGGAINPKVVFSATSSRGSFVTNDPSTCNGSLIASGADRPKIAYFLKFTRQTAPDAIVTALATLQTVVAPIYKIVRGHELADKDADNLKQIGTVTKAYTDYLALFTEPESTSKAVPLRVGRNTLTTRAATVVVDVKRVDKGFLLDRDVPFIDRFSKLVTMVPQFKADNLAISCRLLVTSLSAAGFRTVDDQAYIMYRSLGSDIIKSKNDYMDCLGPTKLAPTVVKNRHLYLRNISDDLVISQDDLDEWGKSVHIGEIDKEILAIIYKLTQVAGTSKNGTFVSGSENVFREISAEAVEVNDWSAEHVASPTEASASKIMLKTSGTAENQFGKLINSRYSKFGCFSLTRSEPSLGGDLDGATAVLLAGKPQSATEAAKAVALRLYFEGKKLTRFDITDAWLTETRAAYAKTGRTCPI